MSFYLSATPEDLPEEYEPEPPDDPEDDEPRRKLTRNERLQGLADSGVDTWDSYRGER